MLKRIIVYVIGILILGFGVILNTKTNLGVAAINSAPYALSEMSQLTLGNWTTILYIVFVSVQLIIYRRIDIKVILQIPFSYVMGVLLDFYNFMIAFVPDNLFESIIMVFIAIICTGIGVYFVVSMDFIPNPPDGLVNALAYLFKKDFGTIKWIFDCCMMSITVILTLVLEGYIIGIGIGTVITALLLGRFIKLFSSYFNKYIIRVYDKESI